MILGFTGTKAGMTEAQKAAVAVVLTRVQPEVVVHGDCVGADDDFDVIASSLWFTREFYPSAATSYRARGDLKRPPFRGEVGKPVQGEPSPDLILHTPMPPLERDKLIVLRADAMLACPKGPEERRSGTWATVRLATKAGKSVMIIWPDGSVTRR